jgi:hypothetical protein
MQMQSYRWEAGKGIVKRRFVPQNVVQRKQALQQSEHLVTRATGIEQEIVPISIMQGSQMSGLPTGQATEVEQNTLLRASAYGSSSLSALHKARSRVPAIVQGIIGVGLARLREPEPEGLITRGLQVVKPGVSLGVYSILVLTDTFGLLLISFTYYLSVLGYSYPIVEFSFLAGLLVMLVPHTVRVLSRAPSRLERICLLCVLGICFYLTRFMAEPHYLSWYDEFLHWRTVHDILKTGHFFSENSMLPVSPYFPGLEIVTDAVSTTTGLSVFYAANFVVLASRILMVMSLFLFYEHITDSSRMASIAATIYMINPHFLYFDTLYNYETLALPLAVCMIYILTRYSNREKTYSWVPATAWLVLAAVTITHHMTDYFFDGLLLFWAGVSLCRPVSPASTGRLSVVAIALYGVLLSLAYALLLPHNPVWDYLSAYFGTSFEQLGHLITGTTSARPLFNSVGQKALLWDQLLITASVALTTFGLPFGLLFLWHRHRRNSLAITLGLASFAYPITQAFRFTTFGTEITDRAAAFLFLPIAYVLTILITHVWPTRKLNKKAVALITGSLAVIFMGDVLIESGPILSAIPGPYHVVADSRSIEPEGIAAATWSFTYLKPGNRIATDRINQMLMSTYGDQRIVTRLNDNVDVSPLFYSAQFDSTDVELLQEGQIRYLVVDLRLSTSLPLEGMYFENDPTTTIISKASLVKFNTISRLNRLFDSGDITIYDAGMFINGAGH